jgi:hypothetical protein
MRKLAESSAMFARDCIMKWSEGLLIPGVEQSFTAFRWMKALYLSSFTTRETTRGIATPWLRPPQKPRRHSREGKKGNLRHGNDAYYVKSAAFQCLNDVSGSLNLKVPLPSTPRLKQTKRIPARTGQQINEQLPARRKYVYRREGQAQPSGWDSPIFQPWNNHQHRARREGLGSVGDSQPANSLHGRDVGRKIIDSPWTVACITLLQTHNQLTLCSTHFDYATN